MSLNDAEAMDLSGLIELVRDEYAPVLLRTSFGDDAAWVRVRDGAQAPWDPGGSDDPEDAYEAALEIVDDPRYDGLTAAALVEAAGPEVFSFVFLADADGMRDPDDPTVLVVSIGDSQDEFNTHGQSFRTVVSEVAAIEANLSLANMDFEDWAESVGADGVFRGFAE